MHAESTAFVTIHQSLCLDYCCYMKVRAQVQFVDCKKHIHSVFNVTDLWWDVLKPGLWFIATGRENQTAAAITTAKSNTKSF